MATGLLNCAGCTFQTMRIAPQSDLSQTPPKLALNAMNWRQYPHGDTQLSISVITAIAMNSRWPLATAVTKAVLSAQMAPPYDAFSTLHPLNIYISSGNISIFG